MLTCCPNSIFLALWLEIYRFPNWSFCWLWAVHSWCSCCQLWAFQNWSYLFSLADFGQVTVILVSLGKRPQKTNPNSQFDKNLRTKPSSWHFSNYFQWFNQWESKTCVLSQQIGFKGLVIYFCNTFFRFLQQDKICMIRIRT